jgi:hypothetical protein
MKTPAFVLALLLTTSALADTRVNADPSMYEPGGFMDVSAHHRPQQLSVFLGLPFFYYGYGGLPLGASVRYTIPILHDGFAPTINDSFSLELGGDVALFGYGNGLNLLVDIPVEAMWTLHLFPKFAAYLKVGLALEVRSGNYCWNNGVCTAGTGFVPVPIADVGFFYKFSEAVALRVELGYPWLKVGLAFSL